MGDIESGSLPTWVQNLAYFIGGAVLIYTTVRQVIADRRRGHDRDDRDDIRERVKSNHKRLRKVQIDQSRVNDELVRTTREQNERLKEIIEIARTEREAMQGKYEEMKADLAKAVQQAGDFKDLYTNLQLEFVREQKENAIVLQRIEALTEQNRQQAEELKQLRIAADVKAYRQLLDEHNTLKAQHADALARLEQYESAASSK